MRTSAVIAAVVAAALVSGACRSGPLYEDTETEFPITITVTCSTDGVVARVVPSIANLTNKQNPVWTLDNTSTVSEFSIDEKKDARKEKWPYGGTLPYSGEKDKPAKGDGKVESNPPGTKKTYGYSISATCTPPGGPIKSIVIDPDIIIIWN